MAQPVGADCNKKLIGSSFSQGQSQFVFIPGPFTDTVLILWFHVTIPCSGFIGPQGTKEVRAGLWFLIYLEGHFQEPQVLANGFLTRERELDL